MAKANKTKLYYLDDDGSAHFMGHYRPLGNAEDRQMSVLNRGLAHYGKFIPEVKDKNDFILKKDGSQTRVSVL